MSTLVSTVPISDAKISRPIANFKPSLWGYTFLKCASDFKTIDTITQKQYENLKQEVRIMITAPTNKSINTLEFIDAIQRIGVAYHFQTEIEYALERMHHGHDIENYDLHAVSLRFRLLRQQGIKVTCGVFVKFKDDEGKFKASLINDVKGLLSLYEAAHLGIRGEDILDEAIAFTTTHLKTIISHSQVEIRSHLRDQVSHSLKHPLRRRIPRIEARYFLSIYPRQDLYNKTLLELAKLDFKIVQAEHQKELSILTQWWKDIDFATKTPFARDRLVELYFWIVGVYFEPQYTFSRMALTKIMTIISIIDDTYDAYGTIDELNIFTKAVKIWNRDAIDILPGYMKVIYKTLLDIYDEFEEDLAMEFEGKTCCLHYGKMAMQRNIEAYLEEARWCNKSYVPTYEEYMDVAITSSTYPMLATNSLIGMENIATKENFDWLSNSPKILIASSVIGRLMDDMRSHEFEQSREHVASAVECYMKQHGVSKEEVFELFHKEIANAWKDVNEAFLKPTVVSVPLLDQILNLSRVTELIYKDVDIYTNPELMKHHVCSLFMDPIML